MVQSRKEWEDEEKKAKEGTFQRSEWAFSSRFFCRVSQFFHFVRFFASVCIRENLSQTNSFSECFQNVCIIPSHTHVGWLSNVRRVKV